MEPGATFAPREPARDAAQWREPAYPPPWGYFGSLAWTVVAFAFGSVAGIAFYGWMVGFDRLLALSQTLDADSTVKYDGVLLSYIYVASSIVQIAVFAFVIRFKRWPVAEYLGLTVPPSRFIVPALALLLALVVLTDGVMVLLGKNPVPEFQVVAYRTAKEAGSLALLFAVIVVIAPIAEEIMFRGFLYRGLVRRPAHAPYAIIVISLIFAVIHQQYDWIGLLQVFVMALLLGWVRWWSGSTVLTILMHILANFIAMAETVVYLEWWRP